MPAFASNPTPNWYPDPGASTQWRYWDGSQWTAHVAPMSYPSAPQQASPVSAIGPSDPLHWLLPVGRSGESIAAGYLGLFCLFALVVVFLPYGFVFVLSVVAVTVWMAVRALQKAPSGGHGRGRAIFGLVAAGLATLVSIAGMVATFAAT